MAGFREENKAERCFLLRKTFPSATQSSFIKILLTYYIFSNFIRFSVIPRRKSKLWTKLVANYKLSRTSEV